MYKLADSIFRGNTVIALLKRHDFCEKGNIDEDDYFNGSVEVERGITGNSKWRQSYYLDNGSIQAR